MAFSSKKYQQPVDDGMTANPCFPSKLTFDPGFALFTNDVWYGAGPNRQYNSKAYVKEPSQALLNAAGGTPPRPYSRRPAKRWLFEEFADDMDPEHIIVDDGNLIRKATDAELYERHGLMRCASEGCENEHIEGHRVRLITDNQNLEDQLLAEIPTVPSTSTQVLTDTPTSPLGSRPTADSGSVPLETGSSSVRHHNHHHDHLHRHVHRHRRGDF